MAITYNRNETVFGDQQGRKQMILVVPAEAASDKPGIVAFQSVADGGVRTNYYTWFDSNGAYRYGTTIPTNQDGEGTQITSGANTALSNLASVAINTALLPVSTVGAIDVGSAAKAFRTAYLGTSLVFVGASLNTTLAFTEVGTLGRTYTFPDAGAAATVMLNTGAANALTFTNGTSNITFGAAGVLDIAAGITANIDSALTITTALTVNTTAVTLNQALATTSSPTFVGLTLSGAVTGVTTLTTSGAISNGTFVATAGALTGVTTIAASGVVTATGGVLINADSAKIGFGEAGTSDSYIDFDGSTMRFYDTTTGPWTLAQLATGTTLNPSVTGDLTIADGKITWTDLADEAAGVFTFNGTTVTDIAIASDITTGTVLSITADGCANGKIVYLDADGGVGATGYFIYSCDGATPLFTVGQYGATIIAGTASGTDALTLTAGDILVTSGNVDLTIGNLALANGNLTVATIQNIVNKISRNNASATAAVLEIEETNAAGDVALLIDSDHTGAVDAAQITYSGTASGLNITTSVVGGVGLTIAGPAAQTASMLVLDGTATTGWGGAASTGMLHLTLDGATLATTASAIQVIMGTGIPTDASLGYALKIADTTTAPATPASTYAMYASTTCNSMFLATTNALATALTLDGPAAQTASMLKVNVATNNWQGAANVGAIHVVADADLAATTATLVYLAASNAINDSVGHCLRIVDSSAVEGTMGYPVYVESADAQMGCLKLTANASGKALFISAGITDIDGTVNLSGIQVLDGTPQEATATDAAISVTTAITHLDTTIGACAAMTLADGAEGQMKYIVMTVDNGDATITPTNLFGAATTIKFTAIGQSCTLMFTGAAWVITGYYGITIA